MNKIYKLVWSKVKNMYVAVAEIAKSHTKSPSSNIVGRVQLEKKVNLQLGKGFVYDSLPNYGFVAGDFATSHFFTPAKKDDFKITVAAIVKNEAKNVPQWVNAAKSCADEIVVVDTGSTDGTVERFADYGIKCFHYDWNDDFASAKNYMISLCHGDWIVLLDGDEWFREGCDVRKAIAKHHNNSITKAIIADWICLDSTRNNAIMFSGGAVRAFRNQPDVRYFRKVHENLTINYENFAFEPEFKMYHTGYSGDVNRSKHERNLRIMRTMFDFDNGKVEYPTDWRYIEDTYAGLGQFDKALWAADKMISYGVQEYSAAAWITKFNVLFAMKTPLAEMRKQFDFCFRTVPSVSGFRFLASIYYLRHGLIDDGLDNYIEGLRMLMGPQDKVAMEHTYWRMYMPEASALASAVYLQSKQVEASLYACKVSEQYCGKTLWSDMALADVRCVLSTEEVSFNITERLLPVLNFSKKAVLSTALVSSLTVGMVNPIFAANTDGYAAGGGSVCTYAGRGVAIGNCSESTQVASIAIGNYARADEASSVAIGNMAVAYNSGDTGSQVAIGAGAYANGNGSIALGGSSFALCDNVVSFGHVSGDPEGTSGSFTYSSDLYRRLINVADGVDDHDVVTVGQLNTALANAGGGGSSTPYIGICSATGFNNETGSGALGSDSIAIGACASTATTACNSISIGKNARNVWANSIAMGLDSNVTMSNSIAIGGCSSNTSSNAIAIGKGVSNDGANSIVIGNGACNAGQENNVTVVGTVSCNLRSTFTTNIGYGSITGLATQYTRNLTSVGSCNVVSKDYATVIGSCSTVSACCAIGLGYQVSVSGVCSIAIGANSGVSGTCSVAIGSNSHTSEDNVVSFGGDYIKRRLTNVANGVNDNDVVTVGQLNTALANAGGGSPCFANGVILAGCDNTASGFYSSVSGGECNNASGESSSVSGGFCNTASCWTSSVSGGNFNTASGNSSSVSGGYCNTASGTASSISGGDGNTASGNDSSVSGGAINTASGENSSVSGGIYNTASGCYSSVIGGCNGIAYAEYSTVIGGGIAGNASCVDIASGSVAIGKNATTTRDYEVAIGSVCAPVKIDGALTVDGAKTVTDGTTTKTWADLLNASGSGSGSVPYIGITSASTGTNEDGSGASAIDAIAIGNYASASGRYSVVIGNSSSSYGASSTEQEGIAIGIGSTVSHNGDSSNTNNGGIAIGSYSKSIVSGFGYNASVALGNVAEALGQNSIAVGTRSRAYGSYSVALDGSAYGSCSIAILGVAGNSSDTPHNYAVSIGGLSKASGEGSIALGWATTSSNTNSVAIGTQSIVSGCNSVVIGNQSATSENNVVSVGHKSTDLTYYSYLNPNAVFGSDLTRRIVNVADGINDTDVVTVRQLNTALANVGGGSSYVGVNVDSGNANEDGGGATGVDSIAIGKGAVASGDKAISIGTGNQVRGDNSGVFGDPNIVDANNSYTVGNNSTISANVDGAFVLGNNVTVNNGTLPANWNSLTDEEKSELTGEGVIALGNNVSVSLCNKVNSSRSSNSTGSPKIQHVVAIGDSAIVGEENGAAIGYQAEARALNALASGTCAKALSEGATALGQGSIVHENSSFATAVGYEAEATGEGANAFGDNANAGDKFATAFGRATNAQCEASTAIGNEAVTTGKRAVAIGNESVASAEGATSVGNNSNAVTRNSVSIGNQAVANGEGVGVVAIGNCAQVGTATSAKGSSTAVGAFANVQSTYSTALGAQTSVTANNSVALGAGSVASQANVVSVGAGTATDPYPATRKIINVTDGTVNTDVSTVGQTGRNLALSGSTLSLKNANGTVLDSVTLPSAPTYSAGNGLELDTNNKFTVKAGTNVTVDANGVNVTGNGTIASGNMGLISGGTLHSEVRPASNGNYITTTGTTGSNLTALDTQLKTTTDNLATEITNRTNADMALDNRIGSVASDGNYIKASSTKNVAENLSLLDSAVKANADAIAGMTDNDTTYTAGDGLTLTGTEFKVKAGTNVTVDSNGINVAGNGSVASGNTGLISGGTLFTEGRVSADGNYVKANNTVAGNLTALDNAVKDNADDIAQINTDLAGKANISLNNITNDGKSVIKTNAKEAINVVGSGKATVNKTDVSGVDTYTVGVTVDGAVVEGNTGIVDGGTVYNVLKAQETATNTALDDKANISLNNINEDGHNVIKSDAKSAINAVAGTHTTISKTDVNGVDTYAVNVTTDGAVANGNTGIVTGGTVYTAVNNEKTARETADTTLQGNIDTEATTRGNEDTRLAELITAEETARQGADTTLQSNITAEETARIAGDTALDDRIGTLSVDGNYIRQVNNVSQNLVALDGQVKANADAIVANKTKYFGVNAQFEEWTDSNAEALKTKYNVQSKEEYEVLIANGLNIHGEGALGKNSVAIGTGAIAGSDISNSIGATQDNAVAIGNNTKANAYQDIAIGDNASTVGSGNKAIAIGAEAKAKSSYNIAMGYDTEADGVGAFAIGKSAKALNADTIAIGYQAQVTGGESVSIGIDSIVSGGSSVAIGQDTKVDGNESVAIGYKAYAKAGDSVALGESTKALAGNSVAIGNMATVAENAGGGTAVGFLAKANGAQSASLGEGSTANGDFSIALGNQAITGGLKAVALGNVARGVSNSAVAIGDNSLASAERSIAIGGTYNNSSEATAPDAIALGSGSKARSLNALSIGVGNNVTGANSIAVGSGLTVNGANSGVFGDPSVINATNSYSVGNNNILNGGLSDVFVLGNNVTATNTDIVILGSGSEAKEDHVVSVGRAEIKDGDTVTQTAINRRIVNVGAGINDTDAVNISQLNDSKTKYVGINAVWKDWANLTDDEKNALGVTTEVEYDAIVAGSNRNGEWAVGKNSIAIGKGAKAGYHLDNNGNISSYGDDNVAIGTNAYALNTGGVAIGKNSYSNGGTSIAIGQESVGGTNGVAIGYKSQSNMQGVSLGNEITVDPYGTNAVAVGYKTTVTGTNSIAVGPLAEATGSHAVAVGDHAKASQSMASAFGENALASCSWATALGHCAVASGSASTALAQEASAQGNNSLAAGNYAQAVGNYSLAVGMSAISNGVSSVAIGGNSSAFGERSIAIGGTSNNRAEANGTDAIAIGSGSKARVINSLAVGVGNSVTGTNSIALGNCLTVNGANSGAFGDPSIINANNSYSVGNNNTLNGGLSDVFVLGNNVTATNMDTIILGTGSEAKEDHVVSVGRAEVKDGDTVTQTAINRRIVNVGAGVNDTDAVNVKQLNDQTIHYVGTRADWDEWNEEDSDWLKQKYGVESEAEYNILKTGANINGEGAGGPNAIAIGQGAKVLTDVPDGIAIGTFAESQEVASVAVGYHAKAQAASVAIGEYATSSDDDGIAIGLCANSAGYSTISIGTMTKSSGINSTAMGDYAQAHGAGSTAIGSGVKVYGGQNVSLGNYSTIGSVNNSDVYGSIALGDRADVQGSNGVAVGSSASVEKPAWTGIAMGWVATAKQDRSIAIGNSAVSDSTMGLALGTGAFTTVSDYDDDNPYGSNIAIGHFASSTAHRSVALGSDSIADTVDTLSIGRSAVGTQGQDGYVPEYTRTIQHVTAGVNDTDAVNVSQLNSQKVEFVGVNTDLPEWTDETKDAIMAKYNVNSEEAYNTLRMISNNRGQGADGDNAIAVGYRAGSHSVSSTAIGTCSLATSQNSIALGTSASAGANSEQTGDYGYNSIAIGYQSESRNHDALAIGSCSATYGAESVALGYGTMATNTNAIAIGSCSVNSHGIQSVAIGSCTSATSNYAVAMGTCSGAYGISSVAVGSNARAQSLNSTSVGVSSEASGVDSIALGSGARAYNQSAVSLGNGLYSTGKASIAIGTNDIEVEEGQSVPMKGAMSTGSVAIGRNVFAAEENAMAIGTNANVIGTNNIAIGADTDVSTTSTSNSVALGSKSVATVSDVLSLGKDAVGTVGNADYVPEYTRKIQHVTAGTADTDAVNVKQLNDSHINYVGINSEWTEWNQYSSDWIKEVYNVNSEEEYEQLKASGANKDGSGATSINSISIGHGAVTGINDSSVGGYDGTGAIAIGNASKAYAGESIAIGDNARAMVSSSSHAVGGIALGADSLVTDTDGIAIGRNTQTLGYQSVAIGSGTSATGPMSVSIGPETKSYGYYSIAIGSSATTGSADTPANDSKWAIAIGQDSHAKGENAAVFGTYSKADGYGTTSVGYHTEAEGFMASAAFGAKTKGNYSLAMGSSVSNESKEATVIGVYSDVTENADSSVVVGYDARSESVQGSAFGVYAGVYQKALYSTAVGFASKAGTFIGPSDNPDDFEEIRYASAFGASAYASGNESTSIGYSTHANADASTVLGHSSTVNGTGSIAVGRGLTVNGSHSGAFGDPTIVNGDNSYSVGNNNTIAENTSDVFALGNSINTTASDVVVLGKESTGSEAGTISIGHKATDLDVNGQAYGTALNRKIVNVAAGTNDTDAVNVSQLTTGLDEKANVALDNITDAGKTVIQNATNVVSGDSVITVTPTTENGVKTYTVTANISPDGQIAEGNTGLVSGGTVYSEVRPSQDGNYITTTNTTGANLTALDTQVKANADAITTNTSDISNLKDLSNITEAGQNVIKELSKGSVNVLGADKATVTKSDVSDVDTYTVSVKADGQVAQGNENIVSGGTVYDALSTTKEEIATDLAGKANVALNNVTDAGHTVIKTDAKSAINVVGGTYATVNKTDVNGIDTYTVNVATDGAVADGNAKLVTGGTVYSALQSQNTEIQTALDGKANVGLDNITDAGKSVVRTLAQESVKVVNGSNTTVTEGTDGTYKTYAVNTNTDGAVASGDTGIVTGGAVYDAIQNAISGLETGTGTALEGKANISLDNLNNAGTTVLQQSAIASVKVADGENTTVTSEIDADGNKTYKIKANATGTVASGNTGLVSGDDVYSAIQNEVTARENADTALSDRIGIVSVDGNYIKVSTSKNVSENLGLLDTALKATADSVAGLSTDKANISLDNINTDGQIVIKNLAKDAVKVVAGTKTTVTEGTDGDAKTYAVNVTTDGAVVQNNEGIVTGGTVYNALQQQQLNTQTELVGKANVALDNITTAGHDVIKDDAKSVINVIGDGKASVDKSTVAGVDTYKVSVTANGAVAENNQDIVTGGAVYNAIRNAITGSESGTGTALEGKANVDASNVTDAEAWGTKIATGTVGQNDVKAVSGDTMFSELRPADGNYVTQANTTAQNLTALDTQVKANKDTLDTHTTDITNLKDLSNITEAGQNIVKELSKGSVNVVGSDKATVTKSDVSGVDTYTVSVKTDGTVTDGNENIVSGGTVYSAIQTAIAGSEAGIGTALEGKANVDASNVTDATAWGTKIATGTVSDGDVKAVSGGTMFTEVRPADGNYVRQTNTTAQNLTALDTQVKINTDNITANATDITNLKNLSNITEEGQNVIKNLSKGSVNVVGNDKITVNKSDVSGTDTYTVGLTIDGNVASGDTGLVNGGQVADAISTAVEGISNDTDTKLEDYAKKDGSNVITPATWGQKLGTGTITENNGELVTGGTVYTAINNESTVREQADNALSNRIGVIDSDKNYILKDNSVSDNLVVLDTAVKNNADAISTLDSGKADVNLTNLTTTGETKVKTLAKGAVNVLGDGKVTVAKSDVDGTDTYTVGLTVDGTVTEGNTGLVTGGQVASAIKDVQDGLTGDISNKADKDFSNIDNTAKEVIRTEAKGAVNVIGNSDVVVTKSDVNGVDTYNLSVNKNGTVADSNEDIVTGGTMFTELRPADGNYVRNVNTTAQNLTVLDTQVKANADDITSLKDLSTITDAGKDVIKENAKGAVNVVGTGKVNVAKSDVSGVDTYTVGVMVDGAVENGNTGIVDGGTVYSAIETAKADVTSTTDTKLADYALKDASNVTDPAAWGTAIGIGTVSSGNNMLVTGGTVYDEVRPASDGNYVKKDKTTGENLTALDTQLKTTMDAVATVTNGLDGKANTSLNNITTDGQTVIKELAKGSVNVIGADKATVTKSNVNGVDTYEVSVKADGVIESGNTDIVDGGTVYSAIETAKVDAGASTDAKLTEYAKKDASNVTDAQAWANKLGTGTISATDTKLVTGATVAGEIRIASDGNYVLKDNTAGQNISALDVQVKANADNIATNTSDITNLKDLSNITEAGQDIIKNLAKGTVNITGTGLANVTKSTAEGVDTYTVDVVADGTISADDTKAVSGATVYGETRVARDGNYVRAGESANNNLMTLDTALKDVSDIANQVKDGVDGKANVSLDNISADGQNVIRELAKGSVKVVNGTNTTVTEGADGDMKTFAVNVTTNGTVTDGNEGIVTGGTVYDAIQDAVNTAETNMTTALDSKANVDASNITDAEAWGQKIATGSVTSNDVKAVSGSTVYNAIENAKTELGNNMDTALTEYAKKDASNIQVPDWTAKLGIGTVTSNDNNLVTGKKVFDEVRVTTDGNYVRSENTASQNFSALDTALKETREIAENAASTGADANAVHYDNTDKNTITLAGENGTTITNLKDGTLSTTSKDAVTGKQLYETNQNVQTNAQNIQSLTDKVGTVQDGAYVSSTNTIGENLNVLDNQAKNNRDSIIRLENTVSDLNTNMDSKLNTDLSNVTDDGKATIRDLAQKSVDATSNDGSVIITKTDADGVGNGRTFDFAVKKDGVVEEGNNDIVTGGAVYQAIQNIESANTKFFGVNNDDENDSNRHGGGATGQDAMAAGVSAKAEGVDSIAIGHGAQATGEKSLAVGTGNVVTGNRSGAFGDPNNVSGSDSYVMGNDNTVSGNNTFVIGNNVTATGSNSIVLGKGSDGSQDNVVSVGAKDKERKIVHVADGEISATSTDAVNGSQLYKVEQKLDDKANADASNIDVTKWNEKLGVGKIEEGNTGLINGGSVYTAINNAKTDMINVDDMNGAIRIGGNGKYDGYDKVDISKSDGTGRVMTGVVTDVNDKNSAANVGYVNAVGDTIINSVNNSLGKMDTKVNKVGANAAAMASLTPASYDGDEKWSVAAAIGHYQGESAGAVGAFYRPNDNMLINVRGSFGNGEDMVGAGVAISLDKGSMPGVSKRQLAKAVNTQAEHIKTLENSNQQLQQDNEQMRRMMMQMQERLEKLEKKDLEKK